MTDDGGDGPYIQTALICEQVLTEQNGVLSAIRIIDRIVFLLDPVTGEPVTPTSNIWFLIMLKAGGARGSFKLEVVREKPSTIQEPVLETGVLFEGEERGANLIVQAAFQPDEPGLYWFDVLLEGSRITRMPLRAVFQPQPRAFLSPAQ
jgi:hypothetical protein